MAIRIITTDAGQIMADDTKEAGWTYIIDPSTYKPVAKFRTTDKDMVPKLIRRAGTFLKFRNSLAEFGVELFPETMELLMHQYPGKSGEESEGSAPEAPPAPKNEAKPPKEPKAARQQEASPPAAPEFTEEERARFEAYLASQRPGRPASPEKRIEFPKSKGKKKKSK
jgi:hypothetical protein